jgi:hypothetical protein
MMRLLVAAYLTRQILKTGVVYFNKLHNLEPQNRAVSPTDTAEASIRNNLAAVPYFGGRLEPSSPSRQLEIKGMPPTRHVTCDLPIQHDAKAV